LPSGTAFVKNDVKYEVIRCLDDIAIFASFVDDDEGEQKHFLPVEEVTNLVDKHHTIY